MSDGITKYNINGDELLSLISVLSSFVCYHPLTSIRKNKKKNCIKKYYSQSVRIIFQVFQKSILDIFIENYKVFWTQNKSILYKTAKHTYAYNMTANTRYTVHLYMYYLRTEPSVEALIIHRLIAIDASAFISWSIIYNDIRSAMQCYVLRHCVDRNVPKDCIVYCNDFDTSQFITCSFRYNRFKLHIPESRLFQS
jgi:hypothetical protein